MVETDWREILSLSQQELKQADKEKLCENLAWMEADDIDLNFTDLKTLFKLAQDILKYKSEQVNNLMGQLEKVSRKGSKKKDRTTLIESAGSESVETITHQEEIIKANKEILDQLYLEIAELEERKTKHEENRDIDHSESSRDTLSEMNAVAQLENEISKKNRHIRKLLADVKILEEENTKLKEKLLQLKDKLKEATQVIENMTEQLFSINSECSQLKEHLGKAEQFRVQLLSEIESLKQELNTKDISKENIQENIKTKLQHFKNLNKLQKNEIERLSAENIQLKENLILSSKPPSTPKKQKLYPEEGKIQKLQEKLTEASNEINQSANLIQFLKNENKRLKQNIDENVDLSMHDSRNESDDGKEKSMITKLKAKLKHVMGALLRAEEMVAIREKELTDIATQLKLMQSEKGIHTLLKGLKNKKQQIKLKDEGIKSLVIEVNNLNQVIDELQLENEALKQKLQIPSDKKVNTRGILKKYRDMEQNILRATKELRKNENKLVTLQFDNRIKSQQIFQLRKLLLGYGLTSEKIDVILKDVDCDSNHEELVKVTKEIQKTSDSVSNSMNDISNIDEIIKENEGLRIGLKEVLDFLKDNSTTTSGILSLKCPTLEAICHSLDARHAAGWFAPHMSAVMDLKAALGGKDALLTALHESRKETFDIMAQLSKETKKTMELEQKIADLETHKEEEQIKDDISSDIIEVGEFGYWMSDDEINQISYSEDIAVHNMISKGNILYEKQLKSSLNYFQGKFKLLYDKLTSLTLSAADNQNKWLIKEEHFKAEIENLKSQLLQTADDDTSSQSPGLISNPDITCLQRKCSYLEDSYKYIRTQNENIKNEYLEYKRESMITASDYETQIQTLILSNISLIDKLRRHIPADLFWKQNTALNEFITKYRNVVEHNVTYYIEKNDIEKRLQEDKLSILNAFQEDFLNKTQNDQSKQKLLEENIEKSLYEKQILLIHSDLQKKNEQIEHLNKKYHELEMTKVKLINTFMDSTSNKEEHSQEKHINELREQNKILKQDCHRLQTQLDATFLKFQQIQQKEVNADIEINLLRHQILDLQSTGDNKAIIARLSGEVLVSHLQASENNKKIERLTLALNKEKQMRHEADDMLQTRQKVLDYYILCNENKFRRMFDMMQVFRQEYEGSFPLCTIETFLCNVEEFNRKTFSVNEKLDEVENLRSNFILKHNVYDQILNTAQMQCGDVNNCEHKIKYSVKNKILSQELDLCNKKIQTVEQSRKEILERCNSLERTILLINQGHQKSNTERHKNDKADQTDLAKCVSTSSSIELEDIPSDDESSSSRNRTFTLPVRKPLETAKKYVKNGTSRYPTEILPTDALTDNMEEIIKQNSESVNVYTQTCLAKECKKVNKLIQTDKDQQITKLQSILDNLNIDNKKKYEELNKATAEIRKHIHDYAVVNEQKQILETMIHNLTDSNNEKDKLIIALQSNIVNIRNQLDDIKNIQFPKLLHEKQIINEENQTLLQTLKQIETEKNSLIADYEELLEKERQEYTKSVKDFQSKISFTQSQLDKRASTSDSRDGEVTKEAVGKYTLKISELEDKCFKLQNNLDGSKTELISHKSELDRWKDLATERLSKMEQLSQQIKERHNHEVESYKAENQHWLSQLSDTQHEHMELRSRLTEQKALYVKQLADKDAHIEQLRTVVHNLKAQLMSLQSVISVNDPSFDLSAIVEVDEASDAVSPQGSERLELKYDSVVELQDYQDDYNNMGMPATSSAIWQEPLIERLRREKHLMGKQNAILRRQIKAIAARERRARLDAQNLKNQVFRITTSGSKVVTAESAALQNKVATLTAQLASARRDAHSNVAIWDKWKKAQQASSKWQARYEEKCLEEKKLEGSLNLAKSAVTRLEKEKRVLLSRLSECRSEKGSAIEKQDEERSEKGSRSRECACACDSPSTPVSVRALLDRVQAQQRRIVALEIAEKGNEPLVSEYEKALAEITSLKGQVLKLESTLLESQIRLPLKSSNDPQPDLEYWKSYCDMLKEENMQLTLRVNSMETTPASAHQQRINDLEQTVLTLRGLVSKLQADQKCGSTRRCDSRPGSGRATSATSDKIRNTIDSYRTEISNLKQTIHEKDLLLERSKEMLKIAAEREDELLRENTLLQQQLEEMAGMRGGFLSA